MSAACLAGDGRPVLRRGLCETCVYALAGPCYGKDRLSKNWSRPDMAGCRIYVCMVCGYRYVGRVIRTEADDRVREVVAAIRAAGKGWVLGQLAEEWQHADRQSWKAKGRVWA